MPRERNRTPLEEYPTVPRCAERIGCGTRAIEAMIADGLVRVHRLPGAKRWRRVYWPEVQAAIRECREDVTDHARERVAEIVDRAG